MSVMQDVYHQSYQQSCARGRRPRGQGGPAPGEARRAARADGAGPRERDAAPSRQNAVRALWGPKRPQNHKDLAQHDFWYPPSIGPLEPEGEILMILWSLGPLVMGDGQYYGY